MIKNLKSQIDLNNDLIIDNNNEFFNTNCETDILIREEAKFWLTQISKDDKNIKNNESDVSFNLEKFLKEKTLLEIKQNDKLYEILEKNNIFLTNILDKISSNNIIKNDQNTLFQKQNYDLHEQNDFNNKLKDLYNKIDEKLLNFNTELKINIDSEIKKNIELIASENLKKSSISLEDFQKKLNIKLNEDTLYQKKYSDNVFLEISDKIISLKKEIIDLINSSLNFNVNLIKDSSTLLDKNILNIKKRLNTIDEEVSIINKNNLSIINNLNDFDKKISTIIFDVQKFNELNNVDSLTINNKIINLEKNIEKLNDHYYNNNEKNISLENKIDLINENLDSLKSLKEVFENSNENFRKELSNFKINFNKEKTYINDTNKLILNYFQNGEIIDSVLEDKKFYNKIDNVIEDKWSKNKDIIDENFNNIILDTKNKINSLEKEISNLNYKDDLDFVLDRQNKHLENYDISKKEIQDKIKNIENDFLYKTESIEKNIQLNSENIDELKNIFNINDINKLISEKMIDIVENKLFYIDDKIINLKNEIENNLDTYLNNRFKEESDNLYSFTKKIKNDTLSTIYDELSNIDSKFKQIDNEIIKKYDLLMINNRVLQTLEYLLSYQQKKSDYLDEDKKDLINLLIKKVEDSKILISILQNKIDNSVFNKDDNAHKEFIKKTISDDTNFLININNETYEYIKKLTLDLVKEEISKVNNDKKYDRIIDNNLFFDYKMKELIPKLISIKDDFLDTEKELNFNNKKNNINSFGER